jgi:hypothetical protein
MNYLGNQRYLSHLMSLRRDPENAAPLHEALNEKRWRRVLRARGQRPIWMSISYLLNAAARLQPYQGRTPRIEDSVDILGGTFKSPAAIYDARLQCDLQHSSNSQSIYTTDEESNRHMDFYYLFNNGKMRYFGSPISLENRQQIILNLYKDFTTSGVAPHLVTFYGQRNLKKSDGAAQFDAETEKVIKDLIKQRPVPQDHYLLMEVNYANAGINATGLATNLKTPTFSEPLLVRGFYAPLAYSSINNLRIEGEDLMTLGEMPFSALCRSTYGYSFEDGDDRIFLLETPIFLPAGMSLVMDFKNSLFGNYYSTEFDAGNTLLTVLAETM